MRNKKSRAIVIFSTVTLLLQSVMPVFSVFSSAEGAALDNQNQVGYVTSPFNQSGSHYVEPASIVTAIAPGDNDFNKQWALSKIQAVDAWQVTSGSPDILIAVLDTGIDQQHEDLADKVVASVNFTDSPTVSDVYGHGTHVAGIIAASVDNDFGIAGLAPDCRLMNVKVANDRGLCDAAAVAKGIVWAIDNGARVINLSLTISEPTQSLEKAVDYAWSKGAVIIAAAGNDGGTTPMYPAFFAHSLSVTSTDRDDRPGRMAKHGDWVDVAAPGVNIYSTLPDNSYGYKSGTSMAAAYVAGMAGLLFTVTSDTNGNGQINDEVRFIIENSCDEIESSGITNGRINVLSAVN